MRMPFFSAALMTAALMPFTVQADESIESRLNRLADEVSRQAETIREQQKVIEELKVKLNTPVAAESAPAQENLAKTGEDNTGKLSGLFGGSIMTNPYVSVVLDAKAYASNQKNRELNARGLPGFSSEPGELRNTFNVDAAELFIFAPVDPYFNLYVNVPVTDSGAELEEAYFVTTSLPEGFQVKGGRFKSNSSRLNAQHPHAWDFADIALPYKAFLGSEGVGGENGVQLTWLPPLPVYTLLGVEAFQGSNPLLFGDHDNWAAHGFSAFAKMSIDTSENSTLYFGPWLLFGKTNTDDESVLAPDRSTGKIHGTSCLYGMEALWKWKSGKHGVNLQGEYLFLTQNGDFTESGTGTTSSLRRRQDGAYLQALYRYDRWRIGARYDRLELFSDTFKVGDTRLTHHGKPWRLTGSLEFNPTEFSMIRAQFTHDRSDPGGRVNNEAILQLNFTIGAHAAHAF